MIRVTTGMLCAALFYSGAGASRAGDKGGWVKLFNGTDLTGWKAFVDPKKKVDPSAVWSIEEEVIHCRGHVNGYLITEKEYGDYVLKVEWRWGEKGPAKGKRNSGVFVHVAGPDKIWPKGIEAQLMQDNAGDFWLVDNFKLIVDPERQDPKNPRHYYRTIKTGVEKEIGQWNQYEITCKGDTIKLVINGKLVNEGTGAERKRGKILLQSEGAEIHFRNIMLKSLAAKKEDKKKEDKKKEDKKKEDKKKTDKKVDKTFKNMDDYYALADKAFKERKPLVVFVSVTRPDLEKDLPQCLHIRLEKFPGVGKTGIVVGLPGPTWLTRYDFRASASVYQLQQILPRPKMPRAK